MKFALRDVPFARSKTDRHATYLRRPADECVVIGRGLTILVAISTSSCDEHDLQPHTGKQWAAANNVELAYVPFYGSWPNEIEPSSPPCATFTLEGADHESHREQASMIRRYIIWRNAHATDPRLRKVVKRAALIERAKVA